MGTKRKIVVTSALPYANGPIHIGHMVEHIQTDIWARLRRMQGHDCYAVCADDAHGTPVMLRAERDGISPEELIARVNKEHQQDLHGFGVHYDNYSSTHTEVNRQFCEQIYLALRQGGHTVEREVTQFYDPEREMFLPDRYVRGSCPRCGADDQHGDNCEECGATYDPTDLDNPISVVSGAVPEERSSQHYFMKLGDFNEMLREWTLSGRLQSEVINKLDEWLADGLRDWDISRDDPYFGFEIPDAPGKYFYVWVDAPIGYMASFSELCVREGLDFDAFWGPDSETELYHFIGKDIIYFHTLFWPAMLHGGGFRTPTAVFTHGFLTVNGQKMSKSRGTFITASTYLEHLNPDYLRYYFAARLGSGLVDIDLSFDDFANKINSDLVGKVVNIASRCAGFIRKGSGGMLSAELPDPDLWHRFADQAEEIGNTFVAREYNQACRKIMALADEANRYVDDKKPWILAKTAGNEQQIQAICTQGINLFRLLVIYLKPVIPATAEKAEAFLNITPLMWSDAGTALLNHQINRFKPLMFRVDPERISATIAASKENLDAAKASNEETPAQTD